MKTTRCGALRLAMTAATLMMATACAENPTAPVSSVAMDLDLIESSMERDTGVFIPNGRKYSDVGRKPATGRAGSALAAMQALLGKDGSAVVEVVAGEEWTGWTRERRMH